MHAVSAHPDQGEHRAAHQRILETLTTPGRIEGGNEKAVELLDGLTSRVWYFISG